MHYSQKAIDRIVRRFVRRRRHRECAAKSVEQVIEWWAELDRGHDDRRLAYILATAAWETGRRLCPVVETFARNGEQAARRLENAFKRGKLRWVKTPYWRPDGKWVGRGLVQLTHQKNYCGKLKDVVVSRLGVDICADPEALLRPDVSALVLVHGMLAGSFTGKSLKRYIDGRKCDFHGARRVVNPGDRSSYQPVARMAEVILRILREDREPEVAHPEQYTDGTWYPQVERIQRRLKELGYTEVGAIDGRWGSMTQAAFDAFRRAERLSVVGVISQRAINRLFDGGVAERELSEERRTATVSDLRRMGSTDIKRADWQMGAGGVAAAAGGIAATANAAADAGDAVSRVARVAVDIWPFVVVAAGAAVMVIAWMQWRNRVRKHRTGEYRSR